MLEHVGHISHGSKEIYTKGCFSAFDKQEIWWLVCYSSSAQSQEQEQSSAHKQPVGAGSVTEQCGRAA